MSIIHYSTVAKSGSFGPTTIKAGEVLLRYQTPKSGSPKLIIRLHGDVPKKAKLELKKDYLTMLFDDETRNVFLKKERNRMAITRERQGCGLFGSSVELAALFPFKTKNYVSVQWKMSKQGIEFLAPESAELKAE